MKHMAIVIGIAAALMGCATTPTYTSAAKGNDPQAMKSALDKCEKESQVACQTAGDGARMCGERKVQACMQAEGWTGK